MKKIQGGGQSPPPPLLPLAGKGLIGRYMSLSSIFQRFHLGITTSEQKKN